MVRLIESDEYSNGKWYGVIEFTTQDIKHIIDLIQNPLLYCDIAMTLEQIDKLITDIEKEPDKYPEQLLLSLKNVRKQYAYKRPIITTP